VADEPGEDCPEEVARPPSAGVDCDEDFEIEEDGGLGDADGEPALDEESEPAEELGLEGLEDTDPPLFEPEEPSEPEVEPLDPEVEPVELPVELEDVLPPEFPGGVEPEDDDPPATSLTNSES